MNNPMSMSRMSQQQQQQQQQQQPGMNCPPGSTNGSGMMSNGPDLQPQQQQQQQQMSMNQQNFSNNQYHQVTVVKGRLMTIKYMCLYSLVPLSKR